MQRDHHKKKSKKHRQQQPKQAHTTPSVMQEPAPQAPTPAMKPTLSIFLSGTASPTECPFWVSLYKSGTVDPQTLLNEKSSQDIMNMSLEKGIADKEPVMLIDAQSQPTRYFYLLPPARSDIRDQTAWATQVLSAVRSWKPRALGFFLERTLMPIDSAETVLTQVFREILEEGTSRDVYLVLGSAGTTTYLNLAMRVKRTLANEGLEVKVFH